MGDGLGTSREVGPRRREGAGTWDKVAQVRLLRPLRSNPTLASAWLENVGQGTAALAQWLPHRGQYEVDEQEAGKADSRSGQGEEGDSRASSGRGRRPHE